jgi:hypothetical protein
VVKKRKKLKKESNANLLFRRWFEKMGIGKMGRHWSTKEEWEVSTLREKQRLKEEISKMRPTCKSHTNDKVAKDECCQTKKSSGESWRQAY